MALSHGAEAKLDRRLSSLETEMKAGFRRADRRLDALEVGTAGMQSDIEAIATKLDVPVRQDRSGGSKHP